MARQGRLSSGFLSLGAGAAGAGLIALAATSDMRGDARNLTYAEGGGFLVLGTIAGILLLSSESPSERAWRQYRSAASGRSVARWTLLPVLNSDRLMVAASTSM
jgi:hypothetical protein